MSTTRCSLLLVALLALALVSPTQAAWFHVSHSVYQPRADAEGHPTAVTQMLVMPHDAVRPQVCVAYNNTAEAGGKGRIVSRIRIITPGGEDLFGLPIEPVIRPLSLAGGVSRNSYLNCRLVGDMKAGDIVEFEHDFKGMPKLTNDAGEIDFAEINGIVSDAGKPTIWSAPLGFRLPQGNSPNGLVAPARGGWFHSSNSVLQADRNLQKQPKRLVQTMVVPEPARRPTVCSGYSNMSHNANKGRLLTTVLVDRVDGGTQTVKLRSNVRDNFALSCKQLADLEAGDMVRFIFQLKGMPKLGKVDQTIEFADLTGAISTAGEPSFREDSPPPPEPLPDPSPDPPPGSPVPPPSSPPPSSPSPPPPSGPAPPPSPPGASGPVSAADAQAVAKLLYTNRRTQLWRPKGNNPSKWLVVGPNTRAIPGTNNLILSTAGVGNTIAGAVADYERKMGSLGVGGGLSSADLDAIRWYSGLDASGGPTSIRRDGGGGYHGEFYRRWSGAIHAGPFSSIRGAVDWMRSRGL